MSMYHDAISASPDVFNVAEVAAGLVGASTPPPTGRRSGRAKKPPNVMTADSIYEAETKKSPTERLSGQAVESKRKNPKRKAAPEAFDIPDNLLEDALAPIRPDEQSEWDCWIELESDPAFFNVIMKDLGVQDAKFLELFSIDEDSLSFLPKPIHGLVFLYKYAEEELPEAAEGGESIWFANQTTDNACATVALLNIIMNAQDISLGDMLEKFKSDSAPLDPPMRGHLLSNHAAIRMVHNSFARRLDLLNADLAKDNEVQESKKKRAKVTVSRKRNKPATDAAYHFIAYVPVDDKVWQLNGLESHPVCIGDFEGDWIAVARPVIEERMQLYGLEELEFNLLALCRRPLAAVRQKLVVNVRMLSLLRERMHQNTDWASKISGGDDLLYEADEDRLSKYGLSRRDFDKHTATAQTAGLSKRVSEPSLTLGEVQDLHRTLAVEQSDICAEYRAELISEEDDALKASARKKDYTLAIHEWVSRLVEHQILQELKEEAESSSPF